MEITILKMVRSVRKHMANTHSEKKSHPGQLTDGHLGDDLPLWGTPGRWPALVGWAGEGAWGREQPGRRTGEDCAPLALLLHTPVLLPREREGRLEHEAVDVVVHFKVSLAILGLLLLKERCHIGHLDVGVFGIQVFGVHLGYSGKQNKIMLRVMSSQGILYIFDVFIYLQPYWWKLRFPNVILRSWMDTKVFYQELPKKSGTFDYNHWQKRMKAKWDKKTPASALQQTCACSSCTMHSVLSLVQTTSFIPCWNPGWSSRYLFQTCLRKVSSAFEISQTSQLIWALYRYTLYLPLLQKSPVWKETKGYSEHNSRAKSKQGIYVRNQGCLHTHQSIQ